MAAENKKFFLGEKVVCNPNHPKIKADRLDKGWSEQYYQFLRGHPAIIVDVITTADSGYKLKSDAGCFFTQDEDEMIVWTPEMDNQQEAEHTGGSVNYYKVHVANPTTLPEAYDAEANDIIESLGLTFAEGNLFKAIWRMAADRNGKKKKGNNSVYDAEKLVFFAERVLVQEKAKGETN